MLLTTLISFTIVVVMVRGVLVTNVATKANEDVAQELEEFYSFAEVGRDPETAQAFVSTERMLEVYLTRQQAGVAEVMFGLLPTQDSALELRGPHVPSRELYDPLTDVALLEEVSSANSGVIQTVVGELRWGKADVLGSNGEVTGTFLVGIFTGPEEAEVDDFMFTLTLVALAALAATGIVSWLTAGRILRPVRLLERTAEEISETDLSARIPVQGSDDVSGLAETFNAMLDRLESAIRSEKEFVDDAGHELRTPITVIRGHLELLEYQTPAGRASSIALVTEELDRMNRIVTDLLALAKAEQPDFVQPAQVDVGELTLAIDAKVQALADRRWTLTRIADGPAVLDAQRITQAMLQLAANAVQHTKPGDEIRLASDFTTIAGTPHVRFVVSDTGPGVKPEDRDLIFRRFAHGAPVDGTRHSGAGLGLAIVKAIADAHDGQVAVGGTYGEGAVFEVAVPVGNPAHTEEDHA